MADYNSKIIYEMAEKLYKKANSIVTTYTVAGVLILGILGILGMTAIAILPLITAVLGGIIGFLIGQEKAFELKLQAQIALCQVRIEENTRTEAK